MIAPARRTLAAVSSLVVAAASAVALTSADRAFSDVGQRTQAQDRARVGHPASVKAFRGAIDTHSKAAVNRAYRSRFAANLDTPIRWTGSNRPCRPGHMSRAANAATLESINFVRAMGGLAPVSFDKRLSAKAQKAALIMSANVPRTQYLTHDPPRSWRCWTRAGHAAAGRSNLAWRTPRITAGGAIEQYMDDEGPSNKAAGHRRWIMYPPLLTMGNGMTSTANALTVIGTATRPAPPDPAWVSWPTAGWFPAPLEPNGRWSLSSGDSGARFGRAHVRVTTSAGPALQVHRFRPQL
jgi:hypothetical protein